MPTSERFNQLVRDVKTRIQEITPEEAERRVSEGAVLVDVREDDEFAKGHAEGAIHLSRGVLELKIEDAVPDLSAPVICYCGGGSRSALAAESLQRMGYSNVSSMAGGYRGWTERGLPTA